MTDLDAGTPDDRVGSLRAQFFRAGGFADDGGSSARWVRYPLWRIHLVLPNLAARRRALPLHDLHHLATGYDTSWIGEAEIAAWELGAGCHGYAAAWMLNLAAFSIGLAIGPRRLWRAFMRGRGASTLYRHHWRDAYLDWRLIDLRAFLGLDTPPRVPTTADIALFATFALPALAVVTLMIVGARALG
jgi:hypothetical protein